MQREEKQLENTIDSLIQRVNDIKTGIAQLLFKIENEYETIDWPSILDSFALISGHVLSHEKCPILRNLTILPLLLSPERDEHLAQITENRLQVFSHDIVPDYLRTKLEPICENKMLQLDHKANSLTHEAIQKQITAYQKIVGNVLEIVSKAREDWEIELSARTACQQNNSVADTQLLLAAINNGKGLKQTIPVPGQNAAPNMMMGPTGRPMMNQNVMPQNPPSMIKAPSSIKTNIKSASQMHPYMR